MPARALLPLLAISLCAQPVTVGVKFGALLSDIAETGRESWRYGAAYDFRQRPGTGGPTVEVSLPFRFSFESGALVKRIRHDRRYGPAPLAIVGHSAARAAACEFPLLMKRRFRPGPFVSAGATLRRVSGFRLTEVDELIMLPWPGNVRVSERTYPADDPWTAGWTGAGGYSWRFGPLRVEPELRCTRWTTKRYLTSRTQVELLVGFRFTSRGGK